MVMTRGAAVDAGDRPSDDHGEVPETPPDRDKTEVTVAEFVDE